jgi:hypothetical protein
MQFKETDRPGTGVAVLEQRLGQERLLIIADIYMNTADSSIPLKGYLFKIIEYFRS